MRAANIIGGGGGGKWLYFTCLVQNCKGEKFCAILSLNFALRANTRGLWILSSCYIAYGISCILLAVNRVNILPEAVAAGVTSVYRYQ